MAVMRAIVFHSPYLEGARLLDSNFGSIAHWLMGKSRNPSVLTCEGRILIFPAR